MIVSNKETSISKANELSGELIELIGKRCMEHQGDDDPAENVYLFVHTIGLLNTKVCIALQNYSYVYGIDKMTKETIFDWIKTLTSEYMANHKEKMDD
jgi:hypothetical protein